MVRTPQFELWGPMEESQLLSMIQQSKLTPQMELCRGNSDWFFASEYEVLFRELGISKLPDSVPSGSPHAADAEKTLETKIIDRPSEQKKRAPPFVAQERRTVARVFSWVIMGLLVMLLVQRLIR